VARGNGANDFRGKKITLRAYESYQVTIAVAVGTVADMHSSHAVWIGNVACGSCEVLDFVRYIACGRVAGQPLDMSTQESSEYLEVPGRRLQSALVRDEACPGC
jgi:hypothetical protein